jgi:hypothetical protein
MMFKVLIISLLRLFFRAAAASSVGIAYKLNYGCYFFQWRFRRHVASIRCFPKATWAETASCTRTGSDGLASFMRTFCAAVAAKPKEEKRKQRERLGEANAGRVGKDSTLILCA